MEGTTQGDSIPVGAYALGVTPLIHFLGQIYFYQQTKKQRSGICWRFYSCRKSKREQSILGFTAIRRAFVLQIIQIIFDCERAAL